ncbi:peptidase inhibitor I9 [Micromonospora sp. M71_S20]|uniref:S8 family peptidase n=1 Tax=Micromonospora sp. M71_S20 TaxID=592872 RepID=UPI000EB53B70|nr:S8 family peptidase [Micromonospora sp. M71_S20]RLK09632.1 peptidase inhibitor I9 [Micromonospora sp. M71_S20]
MEYPRRVTLVPTRRPGRNAVALVAATLAAVIFTQPAASAANPGRTGNAVGEILGAGRATAVPGEYIVVLKDGAAAGSAGSRKSTVSGAARALASRFGTMPDQVWGDALNGFSVRTSEAVARRLAADPAVAYVEQDQAVKVPETASVQPSTAQPNAPWNLDRIDAPVGLDTTYNFVRQGTGVRVYVIGPGIRTTHQEFGGRAHHGYAASCFKTLGTHVAGIIGGTTYGVAKNVELVSVGLPSCNGTLSALIGAVDWVVADNSPWDPPAVGDFVLAGGMSTALNTAVANAVDDGIVITTPAGDVNQNACNDSPGSVPTVITVASIQSNDARPSYSNFGPCVDLFAPGVDVVSASPDSDTAVKSISLTLQASAHVAGMAARVLSKNPTWTPAQVHAFLVESATLGVVTNPGNGSPNRLLYGSPML